MSIDIQLNAVFKVGNAIYNASMSVPAATPTKDSPFIFDVTSKPAADGDDKEASVLTVAIGGSGFVYVAVAPPQDLITAAVGDVVQALNVVVAEGEYDKVKKTFKAAAAIEGN